MTTDIGTTDRNKRTLYFGINDRGEAEVYTSRGQSVILLPDELVALSNRLRNRLAELAAGDAVTTVSHVKCPAQPAPVPA